MVQGEEVRGARTPRPLLARGATKPYIPRARRDPGEPPILGGYPFDVVEVFYEIPPSINEEGEEVEGEEYYNIEEVPVFCSLPGCLDTNAVNFDPSATV